MVRTTRLRARRGFTLLEMILSMTLMLAFLGMTAELFRKQSDSVSSSAGRLDAQQNARFAVSMIERELRMAGVGVPSAQPLLVMAGAMGFTFNADLVARDTDIFAVYINPDADSASVGSMTTALKIVLPGTTKNYPDTNYMRSASAPSGAETISYYLSQDSSSAYADEYILWRRANAQTPRVVARGIRVKSGETPFVYKVRRDTTVDTLPAASLPLIHTAAIHGTAADTGKSALTDSVRAVDISLTSVFHDLRQLAAHKDTITRNVSTTVHMMNAGLIHQSTCGSKPLGVTPVATVVPPAGGLDLYVSITWSASVDDGAGEKDVERYAIYRRLEGSAHFDEPFTSVPAGGGPYSFNDFNVASGQKWIYGVAAQDCTPSSSGIGEAATVTIP